MTPKEQFYANQAESIIEKFNIRGIEGYYCATGEEALAKAKRFLTPGCSISWGGSMSVEEIGLLDYVKTADYTVYDRSLAKTEEEKNEIYSKTVTADFFLMSSNAVTLDGQLVNIDGMGNRVACLCYGPKNIIMIVGMNKVVPDVKTAVERIRNFATPPNVVRLNMKTPCAEYGRCGDCLADDCICCEIVVTRKSRVPGRIKVILVGEELGY